MLTCVSWGVETTVQTNVEVVSARESAVHPADLAVEDFVDALVTQGVKRVGVASPTRSDVIRGLVSRQMVWNSRTARIVPLMGLRTRWAIHASGRGPVALYCWDVWEPTLDGWCRLIRVLRPVVVMATARESTSWLQGRVSCPVIHVPEAVDVRTFRAGIPLHQREIQLLELGRRWDPWHEAVLPTIRSIGLRHVFQPAPGTLVFPGREAMIDGLSKSAISVCFPSNVTHPERSGAIETLTQRYLEAMASGCLVVGHAPKELIDIFGYNPVIESDPTNAPDVISQVVSDLSEYQMLADRNRKSVTQMCSNQERADKVIAIVHAASSVRGRRNWF